MASAGHHSVDFVRKGLIVASLFGALILLHLYAAPHGEFDPRGLLALGFVVLAAFLIGELVELIKLPHITGYLLAGLALGPSVAHALPHIPFLPSGWIVAPFDEGILNEATINQLGLLETLALPLISLTAGGALQVDEIRKGIKPILGILTGQTVAVFAGIIGLFYLMSGPLPFLEMPQLSALPLMAVLAIGAVIASVSVATSDAATIAIIVSTKAKGPMTTNSLSVAVMKDVVVVVAFAITTTLATGALGVSTGDSLMISLLKLGFSAVFGGALGWGIHLYLKYVRAEVLLFLVGVIYTVSYIADAQGLDVALIFIAAGFVASNYSTSGDALIREVERLSMPVFVVFFTLAGAKLHLDVLVEMATFAAALVTVRVATLYIGCRVGAQISGADPMSKRYVWMSFVSQAGLAITLANSMPGTYGPELGGALFSFLLAGVAVNEIIGPALFQSGLALAGELPDSGQVEGEGPTAVGDAGELTLSAPELEEVARVIERSLAAEIDGLEIGPMATALGRDQALLRDLRRSFLRCHRHLMVQASSDPSALPEKIRVERAGLEERWRQSALERSVAEHPWRPEALVAALQRIADRCPERVLAPLEPASVASREEGRVQSLRRTWLRLRHRLRAVERPVAAREVVAYHLRGLAPAKIAALASEQQLAEGQLADEIVALFRLIDEDCDALARLALESPEALDRALKEGRRAVDEAFQKVREQRGATHREALSQARGLTAALGRSIREDLMAWGTLDLPAWRRRPGRVYRQEREGIAALTDGLAQARSQARARFQLVAMELEIHKLEDQLYEAVDEHGGALAREIRGRGALQLHRSEEFLERSLVELEAALDAGGPGAALAARVRELTDPIIFEVSDGHRSAEQLRVSLASGAAVSACREALLQEVSSLRVRYTIPSQRSGAGGAGLAEVPLRQIALTFVEAVFYRDLRDMTREMEVRISGVRDMLIELERVLAFNSELASAELEPWGDAEPPAEAMGLARDLLIGALSRSHARVEQASIDAAPWGEQALEALRVEVAREIETLRRQALSGDAAVIDRELEVREELARQAEALGGRLAEAQEDLSRLLRQTVGAERLDSWREGLGLPTAAEVEAPLAASIALRVPRVPPVYLRLFSGQGLDVGDLIVDREAHLQAARGLLRRAPPGRLRTLAITGDPGMGASALALAIGRDLDCEVRRFALSEPTTLSEVEAWFSEPRPDRLTVIDGLEWLFSLRPGGQAPLRLLLEKILEDAGQERWVLVADRLTWTAAAALEPLSQVFPEGIHLRPMDAEALERAILTRHVMSGYGLTFEAPEAGGWLLGPDERRRRARSELFRDLRSASGGVLADALRLWVQAVRELDEEAAEVRIGQVPRPPLRRLAAMPEDDLLTLAQTLRQGWMDVDLCAELFDLEATEAHARLAGLARSGLLEPDGARYRLAAHLQTPARIVIEHRGWL